MGATEDRLQALFERHVRSGPASANDGDVLEERLHEVARDGIAATVRNRVVALAVGPGTALYHPAIRLAYAVDIGHEGQVAAALLDWDRRLDVLPLPAPNPGDRRLPDVAADLASDVSPTWPVGYDLHGIARDRHLRAALEGLALDEGTLDDVSTFALAAHLAADDFVTLHMVTEVVPSEPCNWLDPEDADRLAAYFATVMAVAYAARRRCPAAAGRHRGRRGQGTADAQTGGDRGASHPRPGPPCRAGQRGPRRGAAHRLIRCTGSSPPGSSTSSPPPATPSPIADPRFRCRSLVSSPAQRRRRDHERPRGRVTGLRTCRLGYVAPDRGSVVVAEQRVAGWIDGRPARADGGPLTDGSSSACSTPRWTTTSTTSRETRVASLRPWWRSTNDRARGSSTDAWPCVHRRG